MYQIKPGKALSLISCLILAFLFLQQTAFAQGPVVVEDQVFEVLENAPNGTSVGIVAANGVTPGSSTYTIEGGTGVSVFSINQSTGELTVSDAGMLDYETTSSFVLEVRVSENELSDQKVVTINLLDMPAPDASTGDATAVSEKGATLNGAVHPNGYAAAAAIQVGTDGLLDNTFDPETAEGALSLDGTEGETTLQLVLSDLQEGTTYYYRTAAKSSEGTFFGQTKSFTTLTIPRVESIILRDSNPTNSDEVSFLVTFSEAVSGVDITDFDLDLENVAGGDPLSADKGTVSLFGVNGDQYLVTVVNIVGDGTLKLLFIDNNSVKSVHDVKAGGSEIGDGDYLNGENYTIDNTHPSIHTLLYTNEDSYVTYSFSVSDAPNDPNQLIFMFDSENETLIGDNAYEVTGSGSIRRIKITPFAHRHGSSLITIKVRDAANNVSPNPIYLYVVVRALADEPELIANDVRGLEDTEIPLGVAVNLVDQDGSEEWKSITISGVPTGGTLSAGTDLGSGVWQFASASELNGLKFTPPLNAFGTYTFTLSATVQETETDPDLYTKKEASASRDFLVIVEPVNDAPAFTLSTDRVEKDEDFTETVLVTVTDLSPANEPEPVTYSLDPVSVDFANISIDASTGTVTITSKPDAFGQATIKVIANDGQAANNTYEQTFLLIVNPVNDVPVFTLSTDRVERDEDFTDVVTVRVASISSPADEAGETITYSLDPASVDFANIRIDAATGTVTITSKPDAHGQATIKVIANDGQAVNNTYEQTFLLIVNPVNEAPAFTLSTERVERDEDFTDVVTVRVASTSSPADEAGETITYSLDPASVDFANISINASTGTVTITSKPDAHGQATIKVIANDGQAVNNTYEQEFLLIVNPVNDAPEFSLSTNLVEKEEDFTETVTLTVTDESPVDETEAITYSLSPASVDFANVSIDGSTGNITITSKKDRYGSQQFTVTAVDAAGVSVQKNFTLRVNSVNDAPEFTIYPAQVIEEEDFTTTERVVPTLVTPVAWNEEGEEVTFSLRNADIDFANVSIDPSTGVVSITSVPDGNGEQMISIVATDNGSPAPTEFVKEFLLRVVPVNDLPELAGALEDQTTNEDEAYSYTIPAGIFTDPDGDETLAFSATLVGGAELPEWLTFNPANRTFSGTPEGSDVGEYMIEVKATDPSNNSISDSFKLIVVPVNDPPVISEIEDVTLLLGESIPVNHEVAFTVSDEETPATELQISVVSDNQSFLPASAIKLIGEGESRKLILSPEIEAHGSATITITVSDGEAEAEEIFTFTVEFSELAANIPDLITPNGDGANDTWNILWLSLYESNQLRVFDRYGRLVFEAKDYHKGREWDGTQGGKELPEGVYLYELVINKGEIKKQGTITIAR